MSLDKCLDPVKDLKTFMGRSRDQAKLIYGDTIGAEDPIFNDYRVRTNEVDTEALRALGKNDVLIVNDSQLMRGLDYRSAEPGGIALLLTKRFPSKRTFKQALGRVGRFDEPCKRYHYDSIANLVDPTLHYSSVGELNLIVSRDKKDKQKKTLQKRKNKAQVIKDSLGHTENNV